MKKEKEYIIKAGTYIGFNGFPVRLKEDTIVISHLPLKRILATQKQIKIKPIKTG